MSHQIPSETTVLIVDDEEMLCKAMAQDFKCKGYNTLCAFSGTEAFEIVKARKVHLIVSDVRMPGGDGVELLTSVKNFDHAIPIVIFVTGFSDLSLEDAYDKGDSGLKIELKFQNLDSAVEGKVMSFGRGGMFIADDTIRASINSSVHFKIHFQSQDPRFIEGEGILRWIRKRTEGDRPNGYGIEFVSLNNEARTKLLEQIRAHKTKAFIPAF